MAGFQQRRSPRIGFIHTDPPVGGDVTVALTGQALAFSAGTLAPSTDVPLAGQAATFSTGTLTASIGGDVTVALSGQAMAFAAGTLAPSSAVPLVGQAATFSAGTVTPASNVALSGAQATFATGQLTANVQGDITVALTGIDLVFSTGTLAANNPSASTSGGFFADYDTYAQQRRKKQRELDEMVEAQKDIKDEIDAQIAKLLHEQEQKDAERKDIERLLSLTEKVKRQDVTPRVYDALLNAEVKQTTGALEALEREMSRMLEEEEFLLSILLSLT